MDSVRGRYLRLSGKVCIADASALTGSIEQNIVNMVLPASARFFHHLCLSAVTIIHLFILIILV